MPDDDATAREDCPLQAADRRARARGARPRALLGVAAMAAGPPNPPYVECPAVDVDTSCQYIIDVTTGTPAVSVYEDPRTPYYAPGETLVGVINDSGGPLGAKLYIGVDGTGDANVDNFALDGHGLCSPGGPPIPAGCPFAGAPGADPFDYEGPSISFDGGGSITDTAAGDVDFSPPLARERDGVLLAARLAERACDRSRPTSAPTRRSSSIKRSASRGRRRDGVRTGSSSASPPDERHGHGAARGHAGSCRSRRRPTSACTPTPVARRRSTCRAAATWRAYSRRHRAPGRATGTPRRQRSATNARSTTGGSRCYNANASAQATSPCGQATMAFGKHRAAGQHRHAPRSPAAARAQARSPCRRERP